MERINIEEQLGSIDSLPTIPMVIRQIQKVINNPQSNMNQIAAVIAKDQTLASRTIRLVNSAFYGLSKRVTSITQAIVILGLNTVNNLMLGLSVVRMFDEKGSSHFDHERFWEHAFATAIMAKEIGIELHIDEPEDCFIGGLIHDIGKLVLEQYYHDEYVKVCVYAKQKQVSMRTVEKALFTYSHDWVGSFLTARWNLPPCLTAVVHYHHDIEIITDELRVHRQLATIVGKANQLSHIHRLGDSAEPTVTADSQFETLQIKKSSCDRIAEKAREEVNTTIQEFRQ
ncbi:MAG: HDOD domain-containing protein [Chitinivibrionales bacterium]|nr:HDOD domain-containing protein [Chitinivibrionales bacterium]